MPTIAIIITISVLASLALTFASLYFDYTNDVKKSELKIESLTSEVCDLKCDLARAMAKDGDIMTPLTIENIASFLKREKTPNVQVDEENGTIIFEVNKRTFVIDCTRLPQQFIIQYGCGCMSDSGIHWDIFEQAAVEASSIVMVKAHVTPNDSYDLHIVSTTHTVAALREDYDFFMSVLNDANNKLLEEYWRRMRVLYPNECVDEQADTQNGADHAASMPFNPSKIQS